MAGGGEPAAAAQSARGDAEALEPSQLQRTVARRAAESKATIPHLYLRTEVDMGQCVEARAGLEAALGERAPTFADMAVRAAALALRAHPRLNGAWRDGRFEHYSRVNVAIAVPAQDSFLLPTIHDADTKELGAVAAESAELAARARDGSITRPEQSGATFTVADFGEFGVTDWSPAIIHGQGALLAIGAVRSEPVVEGADVVAGHRMTATLCADQRLAQGTEAPSFLRSFRALLEEPDQL